MECACLISKRALDIFVDWLFSLFPALPRTLLQLQIANDRYAKWGSYKVLSHFIKETHILCVCRLARGAVWPPKTIFIYWNIYWMAHIAVSPNEKSHVARTHLAVLEASVAVKVEMRTSECGLGAHGFQHCLTKVACALWNAKLLFKYTGNDSLTLLIHNICKQLKKCKKPAIHVSVNILLFKVMVTYLHAAGSTHIVKAAEMPPSLGFKCPNYSCVPHRSSQAFRTSLAP